MNPKRLLFFAICVLFSLFAVAQRQIVSLNGEWQFTDPDVGSPVTVQVPHCWDNFKSAYNLFANVKTCSYERLVDVSSYQGKRIILRFEGVNKTAVVKIDGETVATHTGGFSTFCVDITDKAQGKSEVALTVDVTNMDFNTMPVNSDFTHFGGIYRNVKIVVVNPEVSVSKLDYGSNGVYLAQDVDVATKTATITPTIALDYDLSSAKKVSIVNTVVDAKGKTVKTSTQTIKLQGKATADLLELNPISLSGITLWNGTKNPYLYTVRTTVRVDGKSVDNVSTKIGLRTYAVKNGRFYLNGAVYTLRGVGMHQERNAATNVSTDAERKEDINMVLEMGANAIRTCHYPHNQQFYDYCDQKGIVCWNEIPFYLVMLETDAFKNNCLQSAKEMVKQAYNHPSIIVWGIENEVNVYPSYQAYYPTQATVEQLGAFIKELAQTVKKIDPSRLVGEAEIDNTEYGHETAGWTTKESGINVVGFNFYIGWYSAVDGATEANKQTLIVQNLKSKLSKYRNYFNTSSENTASYVMTEYGAGANVDHHADLGEDFKWGAKDVTKGYTTTGNFHPEEYQSYVHEGMLMALYGDKTNSVSAASKMWCSFAWSMFDFSCYRNEGGTTRLNTKGLVTADRKVKKDAFYLYKANWNKTDYFTHICSKRYTDRTKGTTDVKVYSNCDNVELTVNGKNLGAGTKIQDGVFVWNNVVLKDGTNSVVSKGMVAGSAKQYTDKCSTWRYNMQNARESVSLNGEWQFTDPDLGSPVTVQVPHSWDNYKSAYNLYANVKTCSYERTVDVSPYQGKRMLLRFEGVNKTAVVKIDGDPVATHTGGFSTFCVDITEKAQGKKNVKLTVDVTNMDFNTMPVNSDFTHFGGIYRDVTLLAVNPEASVSTLDYGSNGLYVAQDIDVNSKTAILTPTIALDHNLGTGRKVKVTTSVYDAAGNSVASNSTSLTLEGSETAQLHKLNPITLTDIQLWNGTKNPYLYTITTRVKIDGQQVDKVSAKVGLRTFEVKGGKFYLNGEEYQLRGVGMHQERNAETNVSTAADRQEDINTALEMGANAIRTSHYPHNQQFYDYCDQKGVVCWNEIPFYLLMLETEEFKTNCLQSAKEMVKQAYNHPSIIVWGIENEVNVYSSYQTYYPTQATREQLGAFMKVLAQTVKEIDPSRLVGEAEIENDKYAQQTAGWTTTDSGIDVVGFNIYAGWYRPVDGATMANKIVCCKDYLDNQLNTFMGYFNKASNNTASYVMTEYGAGANIEHHADMNADFIWGGKSGTEGYLTGGDFHPEEFQSYIHEGMLMALYGDKTNDVTPVSNIWCSFAWAMYDFSCYRNEGGTTRLNTKGLVTADRQVKKDAFYLYKANWNKTDYFTHICSSRYTERANIVTVKVYSNCETVDLTVNGISLGNGTKIQDGVFEWYDVELQAGTNEVEAEGINGGKVVCIDECDTWTVPVSYAKAPNNATGITVVASDGDAASYYNLAGQRINKPSKGLYIQNGKKILK